jgi:hypothetical protein
MDQQIQIIHRTPPWTQCAQMNMCAHKPTHPLGEVHPNFGVILVLTQPNIGVLLMSAQPNLFSASLHLVTSYLGKSLDMIT